MALVSHMGRSLGMADRQAHELHMVPACRLDMGHVSLPLPDMGSELAQRDQRAREPRMERVSRQSPGMGGVHAPALGTVCASRFEHNTALVFLG